MSFFESFQKIYFYFIIIINIILFLYIIFTILIPKSKIIRHPHDIFSTHITFIESHRGVVKEIFQNTLESFSRAIKYNIEALETDVWLTKDNVSVLYHGYQNGSFLEGYYDHPGKVIDLTYDELSTYRTINDSLQMPKLSEAMKLTKNKIFMNLEIKDPRIDLVFPHIIKLIEKYNFFEQISLSSFHHGYYNKIEEYNKNNKKNLIFGFLYHKDEPEIFYDFTKRGNSLNIYWENTSKEVCDKAHKNGMAVLAWFKLIDEENDEIYRELIQNGVDVICSNEPVKAKKFRDNYFKKK